MGAGNRTIRGIYTPCTIPYSIYTPREDSFLLQQTVKKYARGVVLDMGTGSGIQAATAAELKRVTSVLAVDKNPAAIRHCRAAIYHSSLRHHSRIHFAVSDLFSHVPRKQFSTIIFNPPYLPSNSSDPDLALDGGTKGHELIGRFLSEASAYLAHAGCILLAFSTFTGKQAVEQHIRKYGFVFEEAARQSFDFETIFVYRITKSRLLQLLERKGVADVAWFTHGKRGDIYTGVYDTGRYAFGTHGAGTKKKWKKKIAVNKIAVKVQRPDSGAQGTVLREAAVLKKLNTHGIGPKLLFSGTVSGSGASPSGYMAYKFVEGELFLDAIQHASAPSAKHILHQVFQQMRLLDVLGMNKEEMHHPYKHIIIGKSIRIGKNTGSSASYKITLLDFERCVPSPKPHNVTQFCQCIASSRLSFLLREKGIIIDREALLCAAKQYKHHQTDDTFKAIWRILNNHQICQNSQ